ncbi:MAG: HAMP domain-containing protein [Candidatus Latescibacteria bacterium]|nr:HAMP domain-containing protein [Candidatus Latescibacterota bacterium]NIO55228.1 HAMP domain-containing protein [Candidatus Latescibacterota bacterium]
MPESDQSTHPETPSPPDLHSVLTSEGFARRDREYDEAADKAILDRPIFNIRLRLILSFSLLFLFTLFITIWIISVLAGVHDKILFLEAADDYKVEIQQARRFEKNFLLYGTNLDDAREHARTAQSLSEENAERFRRVVGEKTLRDMNEHLAVYIQLLDVVGQGNRAEYEGELREHGAKVFAQAQEFVVKERRMVHSMLHLTRNVPFYFLGVLFALMMLVVAFLARYILKALNRFIGYTDRIASGDFTPITPKRRYRDEFSLLALNINRMVRELDQQHRILMESHKLRAMGNLVSGVAHELNNPMNNILLTASLLEEEYDSLEDSEKQEMLQDLVAQVERTKKIVRNLLDFARHSETKFEPLDMKTILEKTVELVANQIRMKKVRLIMDVPDVLPAVHGDSHLLGQVFMNLIINALDVLPEKGEIRISTNTNRRDGFVGVDVTDNGPGMPGHVLSQIFDPFFTTKPKAKGTGLGLSVSRGIVRKLGGYLLVKSELGVGSTFTVLLPVTTIPSDITSRPEKSEDEGGDD